MKRFPSILFTLVPAAALAAALSGPVQGPPDEAPARLDARRNLPAAPPDRGAPDGRGGNLLFSFNAMDNAECIRSIPDVTGDGRDEILVGFGWNQDKENLYCLDGGSTGTAQVVWKLETMDGLSGGYFYGDQCLTPISDPDHNGYDNFLAGTAGGGRTAYNMDDWDGATLWKVDTYNLPGKQSGWVYSLCEIGDVNNDGVPEAAFGTGSSCDTLFLVDGASTGANPTLLWDYTPGDVIYSVRRLGDANGDGKDDILAAVGDNVDKIACVSGVDGTEIWSYKPPKSVYACGVLPDINQDGVAEALAVLWVGDGSAIRCLDGATGIPIWSSMDILSYGMAVDALEDVTGDGLSEIIVASWENAVTVLNGADGSLVWKFLTNGSVNGGDVWTARAVPDLNGDGREDVVAGSFDYHVYALDGDSGELFWKYNTNNRVFSVVPTGDLNQDGRPEVAAGTQDTNNKKLVYILEGDADIPWPGLTLLGDGTLGTPFGIEVTGDAGLTVAVMFSTGTAWTPVPPYGIFELAFPFFLLPFGSIPPAGPYLLASQVPNDPGLLGITLYFQALVASAPKKGSFTDMEIVTFQR